MKAFKPLILAALAAPLAVLPAMAQIQTGGVQGDPDKTTTASVKDSIPAMKGGHFTVPTQ